MTDLITWQQKVDSLLHSNTSDKGRNTQDAVSKRPHWEPKTKVDLRPDVIGMWYVILRGLVSLKNVGKMRAMNRKYFMAHTITFIL